MVSDEYRNDLKIIEELEYDGHFKEALNYFLKVEKKYTTLPEVDDVLYNKGGVLINIGNGLCDKKLIQEGIEASEIAISKFETMQVPDKILMFATLNKNLADGYYCLFNILEFSKISSPVDFKFIPNNSNLQKSKMYIRKAFSIINNNYESLYKQICVNYGNTLNNLGRRVEGLYIYDKALRLDSNFSMAIANKALSLMYFSKISRKNVIEVHSEYYHLLKSVIEKPDLLKYGGKSIKKDFQSGIKNIETYYKDPSSIKKPKYKNIKWFIFSKFEKYYYKMCLNNMLFLNFNLHKDNCEEAISDSIYLGLYDKVIDIPEMRFYEYNKYLNQIKEDYMTARLLLCQALYKNPVLENISNKTILFEPTDDTCFNIYIGLLKSSFTNVFNILDKIAIFINTYCGLKITPRYVSFINSNFWENDKVYNGNLRNELLNSNDISLYALFDMYIDFNNFEDFIELKNIRNDITHRKLIVDVTNINNGKLYKREYISYDYFIERTIYLFQIVKSAIIHLVTFINNKEISKLPKDAKIYPLKSNDSQDFSFLQNFNMGKLNH